MDKDKLKTMMTRARKGPISDLNSCITCKLCKGYFIDATTIIECLHTFCRSCIVRYLESNKYCPICDVQVHKNKPLLNIRQDKTIQDLVYKLVPRLYHNECKRRKMFYEATPSAKPSTFEESTTTQYENILAPEEVINLTLSYNGCSSSFKPRYLRCPSAVTIVHLVKLIQAKYELTERHKVEVFYNQDVLGSNLSLMDVAYIYSWKKKEPLNLTYKIYECRAKKPKLDNVNTTNNNNNNWKEVQLRISENGEMSITGIQDANMLDLLDATENFESEVVINESKCTVESSKAEKTYDANPVEKPLENHKKDPPELKLIAKTISNTSTVTSTSTRTTPNTKLLNSGIKMVINNATSGAGMATLKSNNKQLEINQPISRSTTSSSSAPSGTENITVAFSNPTSDKSTPNSISALSKTIELGKTLNLNSELSVIPLNANVSSSSFNTNTVFSTVKSMCSTKSDDSSYSNFNKTPIELDKDSISNEGNNLKRKHEDSENNSLKEIPAKLPKPTILNHSIGLMNLSNNHPLKKHSKMNRNGERKNLDSNNDNSSTNFTVSQVLVPQKSVDKTPKPIVINKNLSYFATPKSEQGPKILNSLARNGEKVEVSISKPSSSNSYQNSPIIIPSQLPHHQNLNSLQTKQTSNKDTAKNNHDNKANTQKSTNDSDNTEESQTAQSLPLPAPVPNCSTATTTIKAKPSTPIGYKTLRDPPKSWNSQINSQIARVNQTVKAQQMANAAAAAAAAAAASQAGLSPGRYAGDLKSVRPAKFFKGRNVPRYLGNPASGVKPMYQVQISPDKEKNSERHSQTTIKSDKSEIKKHSIVKIDPKTLKPVSEKAPETSNLSNMSSSLVLNVSTANNPELRINSTMAGDLKINTSSVSIFNPLKLQQSSPKNERKSPKSPQSPKVNKSNSSTNTAMTTTTASNSMALLPKQQRDKTSLSFTPSNPFVPNLTSPTLNPNQFLYPAGGFPSYDPRFVAAYHSLWYSQRMAAAAAAGLVPSPLPHAFGWNMDLNPPNSPLSPGLSSKQTTQTKPANQQPSSKASHNSSQVTQKSTPSPGNNSSVTGKSSPSPNSNLPITGKSSPSSGTNKKVKEGSAGKNDKSLESALEKITQNKVKELSANNKEVRNGSPVHVAQTVLQGTSDKVVASEKLNQNCQRHSSKEKNVKKPNETIKVLGNEILKKATVVKEKKLPSKITETKPASETPEPPRESNTEEKEATLSCDKEPSQENTKQPVVEEIQKEKPSDSQEQSSSDEKTEIRLENTKNSSSSNNSETDNNAAATDEVCSKSSDSSSDNLGKNGDKDTENKQTDSCAGTTENASNNEQNSFPGVDSGKAQSVSTTLTSAEEKNEVDNLANDVSQKKSEAQGSLGGGDKTSSV